MIRHAEVDGPRPASAADFAATVALCNAVLRPHGPPTIAQEYPQVFAPENAEHMWIVKTGDRVVSHAATYASTLELDGDTTLRLGGISSVSTDPAVRQRGYASRVVEACCEDLRAQGCHFAVLWTEIKGFYEQLGFAALGSELLYRLTPPDVRGVRTDAEPRAFQPEDLDAVMALRAGVRPYIRRTRAEWEAYLAIPKLSAWVACRAGRCVAYLLVGKGEDFRNCGHEWAGEPQALLALFAHAVSRSPRHELILLAPDGEEPTCAALLRRRVPYIRLELGMFRCLNPPATWAALQPMLEARMGCATQLEAVDDSWRIHVGEDTVGPISTETLAALLLGPQPARELLAAPPGVCAAFERALPLPLFIWGLDSV